MKRKIKKMEPKTTKQSKIKENIMLFVATQVGMH
jgi:hypothetical protein